MKQSKGSLFYSTNYLRIIRIITNFASRMKSAKTLNKYIQINKLY